MAFAISGGKYASTTLTSVGTTTATATGAAFVSGDFSSTRLLGLWSAPSQVVTNPGFDSDTSWTKGAGVTISGGVANCSAAAMMLSQNVTLVVGRSYTVSFGYTLTAGLNIRICNSLIDGTGTVATVGSLGSSGTVTVNFIATGNGILLGADTAQFSGTIDNFTITDNGVFKGMTWVRRFVSTTQLELAKEFFDPATGSTVTQVVGDVILVSKNFTESVVAGLAVSGRVVTISDTCTFGVDGNQVGVCFYDENKLISATFGILLSGGLTVFGRLDDYSKNEVSASIDVQSSVTNPILCNNSAVNFCGYGGRWESSAATAYFIGGNAQGTAGQTVVLNGIECPNDLLTNTAGGNWARNPTRHQLVNCYTITTGNNAIMRRWGDGVIRGGRYKFPNNTTGPISAFGSDAAGTYTVAADAGERAVILDMGGSALSGTGKPSLVRANSSPVLTFNFTNLVTTDFRSTAGNSGAANGNGTNTFRFADTYTGLQTGSVGVILDNSNAVAASTASSGTSWSPSLLRRTCVGSTVTVNATSWTYGFKIYGYQAVGGSITPSTYDLGTAGSADNVSFGGIVNQLADSKVTLSQSSALALSSIATLDDLYDATIAWGCASVTNAQFPSLSAYPVISSGTTVDLGSINLVIDSSAGTAFAVNTGSNTITIKSTTLASGSKFTSLKTTGTISYASGSTSTNATFSSASYLTFTNPANVPTIATLSTMTQGLRITAVGTYDLSLWNFSGNTADVTVANSTGAVTIKTGGQSLNITQGTGNTVTIDNTVPYILNFTITGGTMAAQNLGKFNAFQGVYVSHVAAQAANLTPTLADYYAVDADSNGVREAHGYWNGSAWIVHASAIITEHEILATSNGGAGVGATETLNLIQGETWRIYADKAGYYPNMVETTVPTGGGSKDLPLSENPSTIGLTGGEYSTAAALVSQATLLPADSNSIMTLLIPSMTGQTANVHYAFVELMRSSLENARGALAASNAFCVEVDNYIVRLRDDTLRVKPLVSHPPGTRSMFEVPLVLENYTIDLNPVDANGNYVCVSLFPRQVIIGGTVLGRVAINTDDKNEIKNYATAMNAAFN